MNEAAQFFSGFRPEDLLFLGQAALRTLGISAAAISGGTLLGILFGFLLHVGNLPVRLVLGGVLDIFRSVPLIIQLILFFNLFPIIGWSLDPFGAGVLVLTIYTSALVAQVARAGIESVSPSLRRAARSLGMSYWQDMRHVVLPVGIRAVFPSWIGVALGVMKDSALVSVLGYVELLKAAQILVTRTQEPFLIFALAGAFYFLLSYPLSRYSRELEQRWQS